MRAELSQRRALVLGGSGAVGSAVLRGLAAAGVPTTFTYCRARERAAALASEHGQRALSLDLRERGALRQLLRTLRAEAAAPDVLIHCAAISQSLALSEISDEAFHEVQEVNAYSAFVAVQELSPELVASGGDIVLVGAIGQAQSIPAPVHFAASQGMLTGMTMALAKELGPHGVRINMVALGLLESGLSRQIAPELVADYKTFSALRRLGKPSEAARVILWLALENSYVNGKVLSVNGGL
jgi:3-oxoacyl-[acyl-carrier protein] reductase